MMRERRTRRFSLYTTNRGVLAYVLGIAMCIVGIACRKQSEPTQVVISTETKCSLCGRLLATKHDTILVKSLSLKAVSSALKDAGFEGKLPARSVTPQLQRGQKDFVIQSPRDTCDSCANAKVEVQSGTVWVCQFCGKEYRRDVKTHKYKRREAPRSSVATERGLCGSRACRLNKKHPEWSYSVCQTVAAGKVQMGFTEEQVVASWGRPDDINRTVGSWGVHAQWVYDRGGYNYQFLYFENGILTSWQD